MIGYMFPKELVVISVMHKKRDICHYWHFVDKVFKYESYLYMGCHVS